MVAIIDTVLAVSQAFSKTFGLIFTFVILLPGIAAGLIAFAVAGAHAEHRQNRASDSR